MVPLGRFFSFLELPHLRPRYCGFRERHALFGAPLSEHNCGLQVPSGDSKKFFPRAYTHTRALALETRPKVTWAAGSLTTSVLRVRPISPLRQFSQVRVDLTVSTCRLDSLVWIWRWAGQHDCGAATRVANLVVAGALSTLPMTCHRYASTTSAFRHFLLSRIAQFVPDERGWTRRLASAAGKLTVA